jgi:hypothetical protein
MKGDVTTMKNGAAKRLVYVLLLTAAAGATCLAKGGASKAGPALPRETTERMKGSTNGTGAAPFGDTLKNALARRGFGASSLCVAGDAVEARILREYGAVFMAAEQVTPPPVCMFTSAEQVALFQQASRVASAVIAGSTIELQPAAMRALLAARDEALRAGLDITPRDGAEAGRRDYADTLRLWNSRLLPALEHWQERGRLTRAEADRLLSLPVREQVGAVLECERRGIYFARGFSKSILHSVAAPGASQHLSLLAFDANEYADEGVRRILARHGWFRTVRNDLPHFTYLGRAERDLPSHGLVKLISRDGEFWVPNV